MTIDLKNIMNRQLLNEQKIYFIGCMYIVYIVTVIC